MHRGMSQREKPDGAASQLVAVAIDKDKNSQGAFKWALDNVVTKGQTLTLVHVNTKPSSGYEDDTAAAANTIREIFVPFRCFCTRKNVSRVSSNFTSLLDLRNLNIVTFYQGRTCFDYEIIWRVDGGQRYLIREQWQVKRTLLPSKVVKSFRQLRPQFRVTTQVGGRTLIRSQEEVEAEIRRLKLELKQTMDMYSTACKEALTAKQKLQRWKMEEEKRIKDARLAEEEALALAESEKARCVAAIKTAEASRRIAENEAQKRIGAEMKALKEAEDKKKAFDALSHTNLRYRRYTIEEIEVATDYFAEERKIGEGGYGPVYRCTLDHTPVAIKVLRPDAAQGRSQFQQEVEILCCIRHPNMVLLLGACPEYGCLVYEYMANGSLEDRLFRRGNTPPIPWQLRFRIAAEIGTGLLFLHQTRPEPLVHRDLKPANILLDRNYVSKIGDVGLARLVPPSVADNVTQYRMTATAGTFCYIDPEYQQTGMLGIKSDIYSVGIMLLQIITGKPPMGLTHHVERAIEKGTFIDMLDHSVPDWPVEEALSLAKMALKCAELRRKDRPDLATAILPELNRLRDLAEDNMQFSPFGTGSYTSSIHSQVTTQVCSLIFSSIDRLTLSG
ncbi:hypothetical protein B296_00017529 [Ensete ventricosum]|uniref:RING-type E3 ubiquitin transferase n=1 Tax=Ensete ventricosum TaxID=4639 RepID=A0A426YGL2_ENSVE|nr:hypothetical protein B296_00017529 [Ensete ventricosum]